MQHYLIDTHTLIWFLEGSPELSINARQAIEAGNRNNYVSIASLWEMAVKISIGKLELNTPYPQIRSLIISNGFRILPVTFEDTLLVSTLPLHHRDPFDRIIIAQAIANDLTVISADQHFPAYQVSIIK